MTIAPFPSRHWRALALFGASALLHVLALCWVMPRVGPAGVAAQAPPAVFARLVATPPPPARPAAPARPPARRPAPTPAPAVHGAALAGPLVAEEQSGAPEILAVVQSVAPTAVEPAPAEPPPPAEAAEVLAPPPPRYRVDMPPSSRIVLGVARRDADGTLWHGEAVMAWQLKGERYSMKVEAGIRLLVARVNLVVLESEGLVGEAGFVPLTMTEKRRGREPTATRFGNGRITFSGSPAAFALAAGAQDKATVPLQLAAIARADSSQIKDGIDILVGEDKDASVFRFVVLGQEEIDTGLGKLQAWHLSRPPKAGSYGSRLDIWLAPGHGWYPVQIRNIEASGAETTQTVNKIIITDSGT